MSNYPSNLLYTRDHAWVSINGNQALIGITEFAVHRLLDIVMVELPDEGDFFQRNQTFGSLESVKALVDVYVPLSGKIVETNTALYEEPILLNERCYDEGWLVVIEIHSPDELRRLMTSEEYAIYVESDS